MRIQLLFSFIIFGCLCSFSQSSKEVLNRLIRTLEPIQLDKREYFVRSIYKDKEGFYWIGLMNSIIRFDGVEYEEFYYHPKLFPNLLAVGPDIIIEDDHNVIWFGSWTGGLCYYDKSKNIFNKFISDVKDFSALASEQISSIFIDDIGVVWVGTPGGILNEYQRENGTFIRHHCYIPTFNDTLENKNRHFGEICQDKNNKDILWIGSNVGLSKFNKKTFENSFYPIDKIVDNRYPLIPTPILSDKNKRIWFGHYNMEGLKVFSTETEKWIKQFKIDTEFNLKEGSNRIFHIFNFNDSLIIAASWWNHLYLVNTNNLEDYSIQPYLESKANTLGMFVDSANNRVHIGLTNQILSNQTIPPRFQFFSFNELLPALDKGNFQTDILYDNSSNEYLITTRGGDGLLILSQDLGCLDFVRYKSKKGFANQDVMMNAITKWKDTIYISSNEGLLWFNRSSKTIH